MLFINFAKWLKKQPQMFTNTTPEQEEILYRRGWIARDEEMAEKDKEIEALRQENEEFREALKLGLREMDMLEQWCTHKTLRVKMFRNRFAQLIEKLEKSA